jgi:hypothetical protein
MDAQVKGSKFRKNTRDFTEKSKIDKLIYYSDESFSN